MCSAWILDLGYQETDAGVASDQWINAMLCSTPVWNSTIRQHFRPKLTYLGTKTSQQITRLSSSKRFGKHVFTSLNVAWCSILGEVLAMSSSYACGFWWHKWRLLRKQNKKLKEYSKLLLYANMHYLDGVLWILSLTLPSHILKWLDLRLLQPVWAIM
jgi:hypothetical protein